MSTIEFPAIAHSVGVDVGGTRTKIGLVLGDGSLMNPYSLPTPSDPEELCAMIAAEAASVRSRMDLDESTPTGVLVPGILDESAEIAVLAVNLGWENLPLGEMLREKIRGPLALGHDVRGGGMAEAAWGAGKLFHQHPPRENPLAPPMGDLIFVPIGTGVAAAVIHDGGVFGDQYTGEIGQVMVKEPFTGEQLRLEEVASAAAIGRRYVQHSDPDAHVLAATDGGRPAARAVVDAAREGDEYAERILTSALDTLGQALATIISSVGRFPIVIGGGLAEGGSVVIEPLRTSIDKYLGVVPAPRILPSSLGMWAGCQGAGLVGMVRAR